MSELLKLPIGIQDFEDLRKHEYIYADKTSYIYDLVKGGKVYFLSRPRRFGKSLLLSTMDCLFSGKRELFSGLWIEDKWDWSDVYPVIRVDMAGFKFRDVIELDEKLIDSLDDIANRYGIELEKQGCDGRFKELIDRLKEKYRKNVVILIDEYDKPILDNIEGEKKAKEVREVLRGFYSVIKAKDGDIRFVFITGVTRFSKVGIFSGLNNLNDISFHRGYSCMLGYTEDEIDRYFSGYVEKLADELNKDKEEIRDKIKEWYNGYRFSENREKVYNPFSVMLLFNHGKFSSFWFSTGTPTFLIKLIEEGRYFIPQIENAVITESAMDSFDVGYMPLDLIMYQAGYLTIREVEEDRRGRIVYRLCIPNKEVQTSFNDVLIEVIFKQRNGERIKRQDNLYDALVEADFERLKNAVRSIYSGIPYSNYVRNDLARYEGYYASIFYSYVSSLGFEVIGEDVTNRGRIDITIKIRDKIYIIEFKVVRGGEGEGSRAIEQIRERRYWEKYKNEGKEIYIVGMEFDEEEKNIVRLDWERVG